MSSNVEPVIFDVVAENRSDVLARIVSLLHRLTVDVSGFGMQRRKQWRRMSLIIEVELRSEDIERIKANLLKVVHVVSVSSRQHNPEPTHTPQMRAGSKS